MIQGVIYFGGGEDEWRKGSVEILWVDDLFRNAFDSHFHRTNRFIISEAENTLLAISRIPNYNQENLSTLVEECRSEIEHERERKKIDGEYLGELMKKIKMLEILSDSS